MRTKTKLKIFATFLLISGAFSMGHPVKWLLNSNVPYSPVMALGLLLATVLIGASLLQWLWGRDGPPPEEETDEATDNGSADGAVPFDSGGVHES